MPCDKVTEEYFSQQSSLFSGGRMFSNPVGFETAHPPGVIRESVLLCLPQGAFV